MHSYDLNRDFTAPMLSEDDTFNSHPMLGFLTYRLPSVSTILGVSDDKLAKYQTMKFSLWISTRDSDLNGIKILRCSNY